jgi:hypothetical protein
MLDAVLKRRTTITATGYNNSETGLVGRKGGSGNTQLRLADLSGVVSRMPVLGQYLDC